MSLDRAATGRLGEEAAASRLAALGYRVQARNWRCRVGEIDLVARQDDCLVVVEVRTRRTDAQRHTESEPAFGTAEASVGARKRQRLKALGAMYVQSVAWAGPWRIDMVAVDLDQGGHVVRFAHYPNAVGPD